MLPLKKTVKNKLLLEMEEEGKIWRYEFSKLGQTLGDDKAAAVLLRPIQPFRHLPTFFEIGGEIKLFLFDSTALIPSFALLFNLDL